MIVPPVRSAVVEAVARSLAEDLEPLGDLTAALLDPATTATLVVAAREAGVIAGQACAVEAFFQLDPEIEVTVDAPDGSSVRPGDVVLTVRGPMAPILSAERTALNFLGHLSGIATQTAAVVAAVRAVSASTLVLDTRKTTPGLRALDLAACAVGDAAIAEARSSTRTPTPPAPPVSPPLSRAPRAVTTSGSRMVPFRRPPSPHTHASPKHSFSLVHTHTHSFPTPPSPTPLPKRLHTRTHRARYVCRRPPVRPPPPPPKPPPRPP